MRSMYDVTICEEVAAAALIGLAVASDETDEGDGGGAEEESVN